MRKPLPLTEKICMALVFILVPVIVLGYVTLPSQEPLVTVKVRVDEINYDQSGPILGALSDQYRDAYIRKLKSRGDIEFVSAAADYQVRIMLNVAPVVCGEGEGTVSGYAAAVMMVTKVSKDLIRLDQSMYTASTIDALGKLSGKGTARILGLPPAKEDKEDKKEGRPPVVATTELNF